jgi:hypothetical protein
MQQTIVLGSAARCIDGKGGSISQIVLNPRTNALEYVIVHRGIFGGHDHCVPAGHIGDASVEGITLTIHTDELKGCYLYLSWIIRKPHSTAVKRIFRVKDDGRKQTCAFCAPTSFGLFVPLLIKVCFRLS